MPSSTPTTGDARSRLSWPSSGSEAPGLDLLWPLFDLRATGADPEPQLPELAELKEALASRLEVPDLRWPEQAQQPAPASLEALSAPATPPAPLAALQWPQEARESEAALGSLGWPERQDGVVPGPQPVFPEPDPVLAPPPLPPSPAPAPDDRLAGILERLAASLEAGKARDRAYRMPDGPIER